MGFVAGILLGTVLAGLLGLQAGIILLMGATGAFVFFLLAIGAKLITGEETIVYYHHEIAILIVCCIVLRTLGLPVLIYLDITLLGIAAFLAFGRIGCFSVGCCHGRPARRGVTYGHKHVESGFTFYYEGVTLFPVQLVESAFVFIVIICGSVLLLQGSAPGTVLIVYTAVYGSFRFIIEFFRGDPERPYWKGLSEAQWTTLVLMVASVILGSTGLIPFYIWHLIISLLLFIGALVVVLRDSAVSKMNRPAHIRQIAIAIKNFPYEDMESEENLNQTVAIMQTDLGLNLSKGQVEQEGNLVSYYTVSCQRNRLLTQRTVRKIATVIQSLQDHKGPFEIRLKKNDVFHIVFRE